MDPKPSTAEASCAAIFIFKKVKDGCRIESSATFPSINRLLTNMKLLQPSSSKLVRFLGMALLLRRSLISISRKPLSISGALLFSSTSNADNSRTLLSVYDYLINQHDFSPEAALEVSSNKSILKRPERVYSLITLLKESGFSQAQLEKAIRRAPILLSLNVDTVKPKIKVFLDLGFDPSDIAEILSADPWILRRGIEQLGPSMSALKEVLGSYANVSDALKLSGWCLKANLGKTLLPNIEFLKECGVSSEQIARYVAQFPRFLLYKPEKVQEFVEIVDRMGVPRHSGRYLSAVRTVSSMSSESWGLKLELFRSLGLSEDEILRIFRRVPQVLAVSERKIMDVLKVMLGTGKVDLSQMVSRPEVFLCSVEKRLKPRIEVFEVLERRNLLKNKMKLTTFCKLPNKKFLEFVSRYADELGGDEFDFFNSLKGS